MKIDGCALTRLRSRLSVNRAIKKRREGVDDGDPESILSRDEIAGEDAPRALRVANAVASGKFVNGFGQLQAVVHHTFYERFGKDNTAGLAEKAPPSSIAYVRPVLEKNKSRIAVSNDVQASFEADEVFPRLILFTRDMYQDFSALARA